MPVEHGDLADVCPEGRHAQVGISILLGRCFDRPRSVPEACLHGVDRGMFDEFQREPPVPLRKGHDCPLPHLMEVDLGVAGLVATRVNPNGGGQGTGSRPS